MSQLGGSEVPSGSGNDRAAFCRPVGPGGSSSPSSWSLDGPAFAHLLRLHPRLSGEVFPLSLSDSNSWNLTEKGVVAHKPMCDATANQTSFPAARATGSIKYTISHFGFAYV